MNKTAKRIMAIIGIVILLGIYIATFIFAVSGKENLEGWFVACVALTVLVPGMMWVIQYIYNRLNSDMDEVRRKQEIKEEDKDE